MKLFLPGNTLFHMGAMVSFEELVTVKRSFENMFSDEIRSLKFKERSLEVVFDDPISTFKLALALILALNLNVEIREDMLAINLKRKSYEPCECNVRIHANYNEIVEIEKEVHGLSRLEEHARIKLSLPEAPGLSRITISGKCSTKSLIILLYNFHKAGFSMAYIRRNTITLTKTPLNQVVTYETV